MSLTGRLAFKIGRLPPQRCSGRGHHAERCRPVWMETHRFCPKTCHTTPVVWIFLQMIGSGGTSYDGGASVVAELPIARGPGGAVKVRTYGPRNCCRED